MPFKRFVNSTGKWFGEEGPEGNIVFSSRCRLARNLQQYPFMTRLPNEKRVEVQRSIAGAIAKVSSELKLGAEFFGLENMSELDKLFLVERHLISKELNESPGISGVAVGSDETLSIMVMEEDHLRIQALLPGYQIFEALTFANKIDDALEKELRFAFHPRFGYLTSCPTNIGTGLRASVMLHLPALAATKQIEMVLNTITKINLAMRGFYGEGTQASGDFFQISNQITLGLSEKNILKNLESVIPKIVEYEKKARESLLEKNQNRLEDKVHRAFGTLMNARLVTSEETMQFLSTLRMGLDLGIISGIKFKTINRLLVFTSRAHLQKIKGREMDDEERDFERARFIRDNLLEALN
jgi:protein arginine kinase